MSITEILIEESHRFRSAYGQKPEMIFLGYKQMSEIDTSRLGLLLRRDDSVASKRPVFMGMVIFRVDADSHLSFGINQPSPCG